jgi:hypothetical protein
VPFASTSFTAKTVTLGAFTLPPALVAKIKAQEPLPVTPAMAAALPASMGMRFAGDGFYRGRDPEAPQIGDVRVRFGIVRPQIVTLIAGQEKAGFRPYQTRAGDTLSMLEAGSQPAESMFHTAG